MKTPVISIVLVLVASFIGSFGAVFLKGGALKLEFTVAGLVRNYRLFLGVVFFLLSSVFFLEGIRRPGAELTVLYPMVSLSYIWTLLWSRLFFKEPFTRTKLYGLGLILTGILILQLGR